MEAKDLKEKIAAAERMVSEVDGALCAQVERTKTCEENLIAMTKMSEERLADMEATMQSLITENTRLCAAEDEARASVAALEEAMATVRGWYEREKKTSQRLRNERNKLRVDLEAAASSLAQANDATTKLSADLETAASSLAEANGANVRLREDIIRQYNEYKAAVDRQNDEIDQTRNEYETEALE